MSSVQPTGANELYVYDGNGNMISKTDGDGYVTEYSYNSLDLVSKINYNDAKEAIYEYNKVGELVKMNDWLGETTFELDLLGRLTKATDHKGNAVKYTYDAVGNQTSLTYPDGGIAARTYDAIGELLTVTDPEEGLYNYEYDDAGNVTRLTYPNGWIEDYTYDAEGNLTKVVDTDPFVLYNKTSTKYEYDYDAEGNLTREYDRDSGETKRAQTSTYTYDALNRLTHVTETSRGYPTVERGYIYDSLGNMIQEEADECLEYHYHGTTLYESRECCEKAEYNGTKRWDYTYDGRGNLVSVDKYQRTTQGMQMVNSEKYVYDETGKLVQGTNEDGEVSLYTYNGLGVRVGRELIVKDNTHGYTDFHKETPSVETGIDKPEVVKESYVVDYTRATLDTLVKEEVGGNTDRWLYGLQSLQVKVTSEGTDWWGQQTEQDVLTAYTHHDRLGSIVNLTDQYGRNLVRADYREYGEIAFFDSITVNGGYRRIAPQLVYTNHEWDDVLDLYYAKARFYDPDEKRFLSTDPVKGNVADPLSLVPYLYCVDNPLRWVDPLGLLKLNGVVMSEAIIGSDITGNTDDTDIYVSMKNFNFLMEKYGYKFSEKANRDLYSKANRRSKSYTYEAIYKSKSGASLTIELQTRKAPVSSASPIYYVKLDCVKDVLKEKFTLQSYVSDEKIIFRSIDYTTAKAKNEAAALADDLMRTGRYKPEWWDTWSTKSPYEQRTALFESKVNAKHAVKNYVVSTTFYQTMVSKPFDYVTTFQGLKELMASADSFVVSSLSVAKAEIESSAEYIDFSDQNSINAAGVSSICKALDDYCSQKDKQAAEEAVKTYLATKNSDLKYYLYDQTGWDSGIVINTPDIGEQFNSALATKAQTYLKGLAAQLGSNYLFISSYVDAFNNRIDEIENVNRPGGLSTVKIPEITPAQIESEFNKIRDYDGSLYDW